MYRDRFRKWGLLKNFKAKDTDAIIKAIKQQSGTTSGGTTEVLVRGRRVDFRWRIRRTKLEARKATSEESSALVLPQDVEILSPLARLSEMKSPTESLHVIREYIDCQGCFDSWRRNSTVTWTDFYERAIAPRTHDFFSGWYHGSALLLVGRDAEERSRGSRMLNISFATFRDIILLQTPCFLLRYARALSEVSKSLPNSDGLCKMMARYAKDICAVTYGPQHPFTRVMAILNANVLGLEAGKEAGKRDLEHASVLTRAYLDLIKQSQACSAMVMTIYFDRFWNLLGGNEPTEIEIDSFVSELEGMIEGIESLSYQPFQEEEGPSDRIFAITAIKRNMAELLAYSSEPSKRLRGADIVRDMLNTPPRPGEPFFYRHWLILVSSVVEGRAGRLDGAEEQLRAALRSAEGYGYGTAPHLGAMMCLKSFLGQMGRDDEAMFLEPDCEIVLKAREREYGLESFLPMGLQQGSVGMASA
jgi:hypothetical protein